MNLKNRFSLLITMILFLTCLLPASVYFYKNPSYNYDMLGYMALVIKMDKQYTFEEIHKITYESAKKNIPPANYKNLTDTFTYRKKFKTDPNSFKEILPNYVIKPLYLWLSWLFYKNGCSLPLSTVLPSIVAYLIIGVILFFWLNKYLQTGFAFLTGLLLMYSTFITNVARLSTPDCLSALFILLSFYFIIEKKNMWLMSVCLLLATYTRMDTVILYFFIISYLTFNSKWKMITGNQYLMLLGVLVIAYLSIVLPVREYGWDIFYYGQYSSHIDYTKDFYQSITIQSYFSLIYTKLVTAFVATHFTLFLFLGIMVIFNRKFSFKSLSFDQSFLLLLIMVIFFRFLFLPDLSDRFYLGFYLLILVLLAKKFSLKYLNPVNENY